MPAQTCLCPAAGTCLHSGASKYFCAKYFLNISLINVFLHCCPHYQTESHSKKSLLPFTVNKLKHKTCVDGVDTLGGHNDKCGEISLRYDQQSEESEVLDFFMSTIIISDSFVSTLSRPETW